MSKRPLQKVKLEHSSVKLLAHNRLDCSGRVCPLHHRTDHAMRSFHQHWRSDRGIIERICSEHGVGHYDPDQMEYAIQRFGVAGAQAEATHGCCGCGHEGDEERDLSELSS